MMGNKFTLCQVNSYARSSVPYNQRILAILYVPSDIKTYLLPVELRQGCVDGRGGLTNQHVE
jgi:hypothetical protein